ncbi:hypothetical protein ACHAXT_000936 [Thalassiosira profunda]
MVSSMRLLHRSAAMGVAARTAAAFAPALTTFHHPSTTPISRSYAGSTALFSTPPTRYLLNYEYIPDVLEKRGPHREGHIGLAKDMIEEGTCVSGGPTLVPGEGVPNGALFVFTTKEAAEKFVAGDPYVSNGIVTGHSIAEWSVVVGTN